VADIAPDELGLGMQVCRYAFGVNRRQQIVEKADVVALFDQGVRRMGADEPGPAGNQYMHNVASIGLRCPSIYWNKSGHRI
jgi:hypothetical protein